MLKEDLSNTQLCSKLSKKPSKHPQFGMKSNSLCVAFAAVLNIMLNINASWLMEIVVHMLQIVKKLVNFIDMAFDNPLQNWWHWILVNVIKDLQVLIWVIDASILTCLNNFQYLLISFMNQASSIRMAWSFFFRFHHVTTFIKTSFHSSYIFYLFKLL